MVPEFLLLLCPHPGFQLELCGNNSWGSLQSYSTWMSPYPRPVYFCIFLPCPLNESPFYLVSWLPFSSTIMFQMLSSAGMGCRSVFCTLYAKLQFIHSLVLSCYTCFRSSYNKHSSRDLLVQVPRSRYKSFSRDYITGRGWTEWLDPTWCY